VAYVIGVDGGTEGLRAHVFDLMGRSIGSAATRYETVFSCPGRAEQNPEDWWAALGASVRGAIVDAGVAGGEIEAIGVDTTCCTVVVLDAKGHPLRPSMIWMDVRSSLEAERVCATHDPAVVVNGDGRGPVSAEWMIPKALWVLRHEPEIFDRARTICDYQDFLNLRLTGRRVASLDSASIRWHYSTARGGWPTTLLAKLGLSQLAEKWPSEVLAPGEQVGRLTREAAAHLGLPQSVVVVQGGADAMIGMIGLGVAIPGQLALVTGSSHLQLGLSDRPIHAPGLFGSYPDAVYPGLELIEGGQTSTGSTVAWLRRLLAVKDFDVLNAEAAALAPGAEGLLVLDHFQGNRTPYTDAMSRGAIVGLSLSHGAAHLYRAVIEGIAFGTRAILDTMATAGLQIREVRVCGGATNSELWLQIHADTAGVPVSIPRFADAPALGSGILAATGVGRFATIAEGISAMTAIKKTIEPRPDSQRCYAELYGKYLELYPALGPFRPSALTEARH
jgi:ribulokinase